MAEKLRIICEDLTNHPYCIHGPTLLFSRTRQDSEDVDYYYGCSACRSKKECSIWMRKDSYDPNSKKDSYWSRKHFEIGKAKKIIRKMIKETKMKHRRYCNECGILFSKKHDSAAEHGDHDVLKGLSDDQLREPTQFLNPISNDKTHAQYFFTEKTLAAIADILRNLKISKVISIGAPRLHEYLLKDKDAVQSYLMDIDERFLNFFSDEEFAWFNMFNNYFFLGNCQQERFEAFLTEKDDTKTLLFVDPPFGCRTEPLTQTIKEISQKYQNLNGPTNVLPVFWIFPYYMETYVKNSMPEMEMADYKIDYSNHDSYSDESESGRKFGSPVRIFTNIPLKFIKLPQSEGYKYCSLCERWVAAENLHCSLCRDCPSKNGQTYQHCQLCAICVKPNYVHCRTCGRCTQAVNHSCKEYQASVNCWICRKKGHCEKKCEEWTEILKKIGAQTHISNVKKGKRRCLICHKVGHNEKRCSQRQTLLKEKSFLGEISNFFTRLE